MPGKKPTYKELEKRLRELQKTDEERRRSEQALRETEDIFRLIAEEIEEDIWQLDTGGRVTYASPAVEKVFGYTPREAMELPFSEFFQEPEIERARKAFANALSGKKYQLLKFEGRRKDGSTVPVEVSVNPIIKDGAVVGVQGIARDITKRRETEKLLRESEERLDSIVRTIPDIIYRLDQGGKISFVNEAVAHYGYTPDELIGRDMLDLVCPEEREKALHRLNERRTGLRSTSSFEIRLKRKDSGYTDFEIKSDRLSGQPVFLVDAEGIYKHHGAGEQVFLGTQGIARDITERKQAELALNESEKKYRQLFENMNSGLALHRIITDSGGRPVDYVFVEMNDAFGRLTGMRRDETLGRKVTEVLPGIENDPTGWIDLYGKVALEGAPARFEQYSKSLDKWYSVTAYMPKRGYFATIVEDITERKRTESELRKERDLIDRIMSTTPAAVVLLDREGRLDYANPRALDMLGLGFEDLPERTYNDPAWKITDMDGEPLPDEKLPFSIVKRTGKPVHGVEHAIEWPGGKRKLLSVNATPFFDSNGAFDGVVAAIEDITECKTVQQQIEESRRLLRLFIDSSPDMFFLKDRSGRYLMLNKANAEFFGSRESELIGRTDFDLMPGQAAKGCWKSDTRAMRTGETVISVENVGDRIYETRKIPVTVNEETVGVAGIIRDITERRQAEKSTSQFKATLDQTLDCVFMFGAEDLKFIYVNRGAVSQVGYTREELLEMTPIDLKPDYTEEKFREVIAPLISGEKAFVTLETDHRTREGKLVPVEIFLQYVAMPDEDGRFVAIVRDITERRQASRALISQQRTITLSNRIANVFLTSPQDEIYDRVLDVILESTGSRFGFFGYIDDNGDLVCPTMTRNIWDQCEVEGKDIVFSPSSWGGLWGESLKGKKAMFANERLRPPEGHVDLDNALAVPLVHREALIGLFVVANRNGGYSHEDQELLESAAAQTAPVLSAVIEEQRQKREREKLEEQYRQAQKMEAVGRLAGGVAHDFNNMLSLILGHAELGLEKIEETHPLREDLREIEKAARRSADLTRQLLAFARRQTVSPRVLDLNRTVGGMLRMLERLMGEDIDLAWIPGEDIWPVRMDPSQIDQILANLCVNSREAIDGVGKVTIETGNITLDKEYCDSHPGFTPGDYALLCVSDNGCGMDPETAENIFEPFFTTKKEGTGLGLSTVYGIVKQNGGFINVYSESGEGTTIRIYLTRHMGSSELHGKKHGGKSEVRGHETVLLVEDEPAILRLGIIMLEKLGYTVLAARTPGEAISLAEAHSGTIHLLLTDVVMPEMNGQELSSKLMALYPGLKQLFMSGYTANVIAHHGVLDEGVNFLQKPFSMQDLAAKVREALDKED